MPVPQSQSPSQGPGSTLGSPALGPSQFCPGQGDNREMNKGLNRLSVRGQNWLLRHRGVQEKRADYHLHL